MPQSFTAIERDNPPPRRKSCLACTKAHRRCDQTSPACRRCSQRNIDCRYPQGARFNRDTALVVSPPSASAVAPIPIGEQQIEVLFDIGTTPQTPLEVLDYTLESSQSFLINGVSTSLECSTAAPLLDFSHALVDQRPLITTHEALGPSQFVADYRIRKDFVSRFQHAIDKISASPFQMVLESQMPWCHSHLYDRGMPRSMQDAVSSAALCAARNNTNANMIRHCIESRVQDLLSSPTSTTPLDIIARAHALFIYQVLRLVDSDARVHLNYDATMPLLKEAAYAIIPHVSFHEPEVAGQTSSLPDNLPLYPISATREFWESWIFQESARRTLSVILFFILAYHYMRGEVLPQCNENSYICRSVTLSGHLWRACDPVDFALAWSNERHFVVRSEELSTGITMMEDAISDDIDEFGKIFLTVVLGTDAAKGWLAVRGITL